MLCTIAALLAVSASPVSAVPVADWTWDLETTGDGVADLWISTTNVDLGAPGYEYTWTIDTATIYVEVDTPPVPPVEVSIHDSIDPTNGSGTSSTLGIEIFTPSAPLVIDLPEIGAEISMGVLPDGRGFAQLSNVDLHTLAGGGGEQYPVVSAIFTGTLHVEAVPEPATIALLGLGSVVLFGKRRRNA